ncbi:lysyl oxidase family protein [Pyxidicoccus xibeiensis]|uniref:lysyl oxidase family protein n=1 Tax=Pyxidicoccus xibeiensis TaxID=2906759 RepID=UPI0020A71477|nr:FG-GAP-like repeat-containing protein [Pyxidicoccus xibeiensis]MCP3136431.1 FG-GAP-like repeat-containing protein [Pyxidicoccus xibeiensis]
MKVARVLTAAVLAVAALGACSSDEEPPPPPVEEPPRPLLSETPLWAVNGDPAHEGACFGRSVALGDVDGDGRKDLLVASPPCLLISRDPGRISIFEGADTYYSKQPVTAELSWRNSHPRTNGSNLTVSVGNLNGDAYADVLVSGRYGIQLYAGQADLTRVFSEPLFRVPGDGFFQPSRLVDLDGDGLHELVNPDLATGLVRVYQRGPEGTFSIVRTLPGTSGRIVGDTNLDGAQDLLVPDGEGNLQLYLGCKPGSALACEGPLTVAPTWSIPAEGSAALPDVSGDGRPDLFLTGLGETRLHLSQAEGGFSSTPAWRLLDDAAFFGLGAPIVTVGDVTGDGQAHDFVMGATSRLYLFAPTEHVSGPLRPVWAWPRADRYLPASLEIFTAMAVAAPGDMNGDGHDDLVVGLTPREYGKGTGRVWILGGGEVPATPESPPHLPEAKSCDLEVDLENGKADLTVDADVLARTLYVERRTFAAEACEVLEGCVAAGNRRLLRFTSSIVNMGRGSAIVPSPTERPDLFVFDECHGHDHLIDFASYALRDAGGTLTSVGRKQGFYMVDFTRYCTDAPSFTDYFPRTGISPGWSDVYSSETPCQWLDITDVADGEYAIDVGVDEKDVIEEEGDLPNQVSVRFRLSGDTVTVLP